MMDGVEAGPLGVRNPRKLTTEQVLETLDSDTGMGILRIFPHLRIFFSVLPIFRISADFCSFEL